MTNQELIKDHYDSLADLVIERSEKIKNAKSDHDRDAIFEDYQSDINVYLKDISDLKQLDPNTEAII